MGENFEKFVFQGSFWRLKNGYKVFPKFQIFRNLVWYQPLLNKRIFKDAIEFWKIENKHQRVSTDGLRLPLWTVDGQKLVNVVNWNILIKGVNLSKEMLVEVQILEHAEISLRWPFSSV